MALTPFNVRYKSNSASIVFIGSPIQSVLFVVHTIRFTVKVLLRTKLDIILQKYKKNHWKDGFCSRKIELIDYIQSFIDFIRIYIKYTCLFLSVL